MNKFTKINLAILGLSLSNVATAQDIDELVVTAKGGQTLQNVLPTTHVFTQSDIDAAQVKDVPALLDSIPGVSVVDSGGRGSATSVFLRGTTGSQTIVLIDGVRVGSATLGSAALNSYPVEAIERIEVIKGPFSGIYGADAVGGVIQLFTKKSGDGLGIATATVGSDALTEYGIAFNGGNERNGFHVSVNREDGDGIDRTSIISDGNDDDDSFEETAASFGGRVTLSDSVVANLNILYTDNTVEFDNTFGADTGFETDNTTLSTALNITAQLSDSVEWVTTLGVNEDESVTDVFFSDITTERNSIGTEFAFKLSDNNRLTLGAEYFDEEVETLTDFPETERDNTAAYAQLQASSGAFGFVGSIRYDDNSAYGSDTNVSVAFNYDFTESVRGIASYGSAFSAPSFNQLFFPFFGNPDIQPEESDSYELSLVGNHNHYNWRVSAYKTDVTNLIGFDINTFLAGNIDEADFEGIEFEIGAKIAQWDISAGLDLLSAENALTGEQLDNRAEQTIRLSASRDFGKFDLRFDIKGENDRVDAGGIEVSSYALFDISGSYTINDQWKVFANIDNIFDKDYTVNLVNAVERFNTEGTQAKLTVKYSF